MNYRQPLLQRQVAQLVSGDGTVPPETEALLRTVDATYEQMEGERQRLEKALDAANRERIDLREKLTAQQSRHVEALGVLAGGIAHDINNMLTIVMSNTSLAMLDDTAMACVGDCLRDIQNGAARARDLTQQLTTFAKIDSPLRSPVVLPTLVRDATETHLRGLPIQTEMDCTPDLWPAQVDPEQVGLLVQNLLLNAAQSIADAGVVRLVLRNEVVAAGGPLPLKPGRYVRLTVIDSGRGVSPELLPRLFEPYSHPRRAGSGLGLATVYAIVKKHEGHIEVESSAGRGTTFNVWFAAAELASATAAPWGQTRPSLNVGPSVRVLVMDDEGTILRVTAALLKRMGLEATVVSTGEEAVRAFAEARSAGTPFGLLIFDLAIPGAMGGREAIELIRQMDKEVPAIVSSGYSNDPVMSDFARYGFQAMVTKPYFVNDLAKTIRQVLARSGQNRLAAVA